MKKLGQILIVGVIAAAAALFFLFDLERYLALDYLKAQHHHILSLVRDHPLGAVLLYFLVYVVVTALSLPGALVLSLGAGALFGLLTGSVVVVAAATLGATLAFLAARFVLRDSVQRRFGARLAAINRGIEKDGGFYLFTLRLVPVFPFFIINLLMALTPLRTRVFILVSLAGMLPGSVVFVNTGTQLAKIETLGGILSPDVVLSFVLLGVFPLVARKLISWLKARRVYRNYTKPRRFDNNLVVIGAGSAGLVSAYIAATLKARVTLIEKHRMGGDCLNSGCVPSKALLRSARFLAEARRAADLGLDVPQVSFDFSRVMERVRRVIAAIEPHDSVERFTGLGVHCVQGEARIRSPWEVEVNGRALHTRAIIIASGARPLVPPIPGLDRVDYYTFENLWEINELPRRLLVLGGGAAGCEMTQAFARFGSSVTQVEMQPRIMPLEDADASQLVTEQLRAEGVDVRTGHKAVEFCVDGDGRKTLLCEHQGQSVSLPFDRVLLALGRAPNIGGFGLEELGIALNPNKTIEVNEFLQTGYPNIYACGDVAGPYQFTHTAAHQGVHAAINALLGHFWKIRPQRSVIPWATFTEPEVARVGLNEQDAQRDGVPYEVTRYGLDELDRAITDEAAHGFVKVLTVPGKDRLLGATIVGEHAGDLIVEFTTALKEGRGLSKILNTIHIYPTMSEAATYVAGQWKRAHASQRGLRWLGRYHKMRLR